ncbi:MAG TPA: ImmA/IrrE family metallo-endopeptidase [Candidatus Wallbacteria bacterium]|nr:ImmA/IrrE family metallo-endopeptidase [Candidatus Wallbacteria bacterium]
MKLTVKEILKTLEERLANIDRSALVKLLSVRACHHHSYSLNNLITAGIQLAARRGASFSFDMLSELWLAPFPIWQRWGYHITRGEKALSVLAPIRIKKKRDIAADTELAEHGLVSVVENEADDDKNSRGSILVFISRPLFDVSQCERISPNPNMPHRQITEQILPIQFISLIQRIRDHGLTVEFLPLRENTGGYLQADRIVVNKNNTPEAQYATLLHELSHYCLGHGAGLPRKDLAVAELEAEATAFTVASYFGITVPSEFYIAAWGGDGAAVRKSIGRIDQAVTAALKILKVPGISEDSACLERAA